MITAIFVFLAIVIVHGWYRACWDVAQQKWAKKEIKIVTENAPPHIDVRAEARVDAVDLMLGVPNSAQVLARAYDECIEQVLVEAVKHISLTREPDDYTHTIRIAARIRVIPGGIVAEATRDSFKDGEGWLSSLDFQLGRAAWSHPVLTEVLQRERGRA